MDPWKCPKKALSLSQVLQAESSVVPQLLQVLHLCAAPWRALSNYAWDSLYRNIFISSLRISHMCTIMYIYNFDYIRLFLLILPELLSIPHPIPLYVLLKNNALSPIYAAHIPSCVWEHLLGCGQPTRNHTLKEKGPPAPTSHQLSVASQLGVGRFMMNSFLSMLEC